MGTETLPQASATAWGPWAHGFRRVSDGEVPQIFSYKPMGINIERGTAVQP